MLLISERDLSNSYSYFPSHRVVGCRTRSLRGQSIEKVTLLCGLFISMRIITLHHNDYLLLSHRKFRSDWPWEQDRQMAIFHRMKDSIQLASQPDQAFMQVEVPGSRRIRGGWCLSHIPRSGCFISHYCEDQKSKRRLLKRYSQLLHGTQMQNVRMEINNLRFDDKL